MTTNFKMDPKRINTTGRNIVVAARGFLFALTLTLSCAATAGAADTQSDLQIFLDLHAATQRQPDNAEIAADYANHALALYRREGDARYAGYASRALQAWLDEATPPHRVWLLRARLAQLAHRFEEAAVDLEHLLAVYPKDIEARLLAADSRRRAGHIDASRRHCFQLALSSSTTLAEYCSVQILLSLGQTNAASELAARAQTQFSAIEAVYADWARAITAEALRSNGQTDRAIELLSQIEPAALDIATRLSLVDMLIDVGDHTKAHAMLDNLPQTPGTLLRLAQLNIQPHATDAKAALLEQFAIAAQRNEVGLHSFEHAALYLHVIKDYDKALDLAIVNWQLQKNVEDAQLLERAALMAGSEIDHFHIQQWRKQWTSKL